MPAERVSMRRVREILRLKFECGSSDRAIAVAVSVARSTVQLCVARFAAAGLSWPLPGTLTEQGLEALLFAPLGGSKLGKRLKAEPDWAAIHRELRRPGVTLLLLWEEYPGSGGQNCTPKHSASLTARFARRKWSRPWWRASSPQTHAEAHRAPQAMAHDHRTG